MIDRETIGFYDQAAQRMGGLNAEQGEQKGQSGRAEPFIALLLETTA